MKLWEREATDKYCPIHLLDKSVNSQAACQALCESMDALECVGIASSHKTGYTDYCYLCTDDALKSAYNGFRFYRRPGTFEI